MTPEEFWHILHSVPDPPPVFFRLYYDENTGNPLFYSMDDVPGTYITIDAETYARSSMQVKVKDGNIVHLKLPRQPKLVPGSGTPCHPQSVAIVVDQDQPNTKWSLKYCDED